MTEHKARVGAAGVHTNREIDGRRGSFGYNRYKDQVGELGRQSPAPNQYLSGFGVHVPFPIQLVRVPALFPYILYICITPYLTILVKTSAVAN